MPFYVVSYDLRRERTSEAYEAIHAVLRHSGVYCWPLESFWIIQTALTPSGILDALLRTGVTDENDGVVIIEVTRRGAYRLVKDVTCADWLDWYLIHD